MSKTFKERQYGPFHARLERWLDGYDQAFHPIPPMRLLWHIISIGGTIGVSVVVAWVLLCYGATMLSLAYDCGAAVLWVILATAAATWLFQHWTYEALFRKMRKHGMMKFDWKAGYRSYVHGEK